MRIRKRKVPLPLSLLSPVPLTDPHLFSRSPVQPPADDNNLTTTTPTCSSDHFTTPTCCSDTSASDLLLRLAATPTHASLPITGVDEGVLMSNNDDASNATITTTTTTTTTRCAPAYHNNDNPNNNNNRPLLLSLSNNEGRWCDGDRAIPLKKRRTMIMKCDLESGSSLGKKDDEVKSTVTSDQISCVVNDDNGNDNSKREVVAVAGTSAKKGNSKRGNTIMEGSRCSRVNGRGWRCCQPTLVGYSLCEHHLGKGRLRSMASTAKARSSSSTKKNANNDNSFAIGDHEERETVDSKDNNEKKMERMSSFGNNSNNSKRAKLGVVKARSLSSLLGQTNTMNNNIVGDHANVHQQEGNNN